MMVLASNVFKCFFTIHGGTLSSRKKLDVKASLLLHMLQYILFSLKNILWSSLKSPISLGATHTF
jgi:ABC-type transporter Mla maintaining outer membrane lipid asymmetry permease subunit MlaE